MGGLLKLADFLDAFNERLGKALGVLVIALVIVQFAIVIMSANFKAGSIWLQESLLYMNSLMFLGAAGFVLLKDEHVRVDIFYRDKSERTKSIVDLLGHLLLLLPFMVFIWIIGSPYVATSWANLEGSFETSGLQIVFILKSFFLLFALTLSFQGLSGIIRALNKIMGGK
jgi:TRAP-type mannitol/chloroaromatic compound transport system permease small subunit